MNEEMTAYQNLWIAVLKAGIEDALDGWNEDIAWLKSEDFNEICSNASVNPEFAYSLYAKRWKPVELKERHVPKPIIRREVKIMPIPCALCGNIMNIDVKGRHVKKTCSPRCTTMLRHKNRKEQNECN